MARHSSRARGPGRMAVPLGDSISRGSANYEGTGGLDRWEGTAPVRMFPPNGFGLFDMAGNVEEWVSDFWGEYKSGNPRDPSGPMSGQYGIRRGGSFFSPPNFLRVSRRTLGTPRWPTDELGFRCVREAVEDPGGSAY